MGRYIVRFEACGSWLLSCDGEGVRVEEDPSERNSSRCVCSLLFQHGRPGSRTKKIIHSTPASKHFEIVFLLLPTSFDPSPSPPLRRPDRHPTPPRQARANAAHDPRNRRTGHPHEPGRGPSRGRDGRGLPPRPWRELHHCAFPSQPPPPDPANLEEGFPPRGRNR